MKQCIGALFFIAFVAPAILAAEDEYPGTTRFVAASQAMINSPTVPPQVKELFKIFLETIAAKRLCIDQANLKCILGVFKDIGIPEMKKGISMTQKSLKKMLQSLLGLNRKAVSELSKLPESAGKIGVQIADKIVDKKATVINEYLGKQ